MGDKYKMLLSTEKLITNVLGAVTDKPDPYSWQENENREASCSRRNEWHDPYDEMFVILCAV